MVIPLNGFDREEHDGNLHAKNVSIVGGSLTVNSTATVTLYSTPTIYAVVNTAAGGGNVTVQQGTTPWASSILGNVTISDSKSFIGLVSVGGGILNTVTAVTDITNPVALKGNLTLSDSKGFIGLVTIGGGTIGTTFSGNVTLDPGSKTGIVGNVTITDSKSFIGLVSVGGGVLNTVTAVTDITNPVALKGNLTLSDSKGFIGLVTIGGGTIGTTFAGNVTLDPGSKTGIVGNVTISDSKSFIGLVSVGGGILNTVTAVTDITNPVAIKGNLTLSDSKTFIGLVTAWNRNAGTTKTLTTLPITLSTSSVATIAVPTNANVMYITNLLFSSNATVRISIKSGVTYLTGNATIGVTLNPGGGWVQTGAPDSPSFIGCPSGAIVVEKFDLTGTSALVGGNITYFQE